MTEQVTQQKSSDLFQVEEQEHIIPESAPVMPDLTPEIKDDLVSQASIAALSVGKNAQSVKQQAQQLATYGDDNGIRSLISETEYEIEKQTYRSNMIRLAQDGAVDILANQMVASTVQKINKYALEDKVVETLSNLPKEITEVVDESVLTDIAKDQAFNLKVSNFIAVAQSKEDDENILQETIDFFKLIIPVQISERFLFGGGESSINSDLRGALYQARQLPLEQQDAFLAGPVQEFIDDIQFLTNNPDTTVELMSAAADGSDKALDDLLFWQAIDLLAAPFDVGAHRLLKGGKVALSLGNKRVLAEDIVKPVNEREIIKTDKDALQAVSSMRIPFDRTDGIAGEIAKSLEKNEKLLQHRLDNFTAPESLDSIERRNNLAFESSYGTNRILRSDISMEGKGNVNFQVGTVKGTPFKSEVTAQNFIANNKLDGKVVKRKNGGFVVEMNSPLYGIDSATHTDISWFSKNYGNIDTIISKSIVAGGRSVEGAMNAVFETAAAVHKNSLKILGTRKGRDLVRVLEKGIDDDKWLSQEELIGRYRSLIGRDPADVEFEAYFAYKQLNDFDYELKLKAFRDDAIAKGQRGIELPDGTKFNAAPKSFDNITKDGKLNGPVHVIETIAKDSVTIPKNGLDAEEMLKLRDTHDLFIIDPNQVSKFFEDGITTEPTRNILLPKGTKLSDVDYNALVTYKAGGRRRNKSPSYIKVGRSKMGSGGLVRLPDIATHGAVSKKKGKEFASSMNDIFDKLKNRKDTPIEMFDDLVASKKLEAIGIYTARQADEFFSGHELYKYDNIEFQAVRDRELVTMNIGTDISLVDETEEPIMSSVRNEMNGMRGDRLKNIDGEDSLILDPLAALADSLNTTARFASVKAYRQNTLDFMSERFGKYLDHDTSGSPIGLLTANVSPQYSKDRGLVNVIQAHQEYIKEIISRRVGYEESFLQKMESGVNWVFDFSSDIRKGLQDGWVEKGEIRKAALNVATKDPAGRLKNLVFNAKLGLFNPASFVMQALNVTNIVALSPKHGLQATKNAVPLMLALTGGVDDAMKQVIAKGWKVGGFRSEEDFLSYVSEFKAMGLGNLNRGIAEISGINGAQLGTSAAGAVADWGRVFFNQGEMLSRATSYGAARLRWVDDIALNPKKLPPDSPEGRLWIQNESHRLSVGLSTADVQLGFRGLAGVPFQFFSYPFRLTGAMLPRLGKKGLKGDAAFTGAEKSRLIAMNAFLYGAAGVPLVDGIVGHYTANNPDLDIVEARALTNGFIDSMVYQLSESTETNLAGRAGIGQFYTDLARTLRGAGTNKSTLEFMMGAGGNNFVGMVGATIDATRGYAVFQNPNKDTIGEAGWALLKAEISSLKMADKIIAARRYGYLFTKTGARLAKISNMETWLMGAGLPPQAYETLSLTFISDEDRRAEISRLTGMFMSVNQKIDGAILTGNEEKRKHFEQTLSILGLSAQDQGITDDVMRSIISAEGDSMLETRWMKMMKRHGGLGSNQDVMRQDKGEE